MRAAPSEDSAFTRSIQNSIWAPTSVDWASALTLVLPPLKAASTMPGECLQKWAAWTRLEEPEVWQDLLWS